jgi:hypothetical protein
VRANTNCGQLFPVPMFWPGKSLAYKVLQNLATGVIGYGNTAAPHR